MAHHLHVDLALVHQSLSFKRGGGTVVGELGPFHRNQWQDVDDVDSQILDVLDQFRDVMVVDTGNHDDVNLDDHSEFGALAYAFELSVYEDGGGFDTGEFLPIYYNRIIYLGTDVRVTGIHGNGDEPYAKIMELLCGTREGQTIGGDAECQVREFPVEHLQCFECRLVGKWVTGAGYTYDLEFRNAFLDVADLLDRFQWSQDLAGDTWARFIAAIELTIAVVALDVAVRCYREVHASEFVMRFLVVAWVF